MRTLILLIALAGLVACDHTAWQPEIMDPATGNVRTLSSKELAGKTIVVNYWASWCKPCIEEIPELNRFAEQHAADVIVLAVNFDQPEPGRQQAAAQQAGIRYPLLVENPAVALKLPDIEGLPMTFIVSDAGVVRQVLAGPQTLASLEATLKR